MRRAAIAVAVAALAIGLIVPAASAAGAGRNDKAQAAGGVQVERNLTYRDVGGEKLKLDAYLPVGEGIRPGVMVIYGGGWILGSKQLSGPMAEMREPRSCGPWPRVASMAERCPPAEPPIAPMRAGSRPKSNAWSRTHATLACTSSTAAGKGWTGASR